MRITRVQLFLVLTVLVFVLVVPVSAANTGKIAFVSDENVLGYRSDNIHVMNPDGSGVTQLTTAGGIDPDWSPDGTKIVYSDDDDSSPMNHLHIMNADGTGNTQVTFFGEDTVPAWSPDGTKIAFKKRQGSGFDVTEKIYIINADGTGERPLTTDDEWYSNPAWSPDGTKVFFDDGYYSYVINADGTGKTLYRTNAWHIAWSPDGMMVAFVTHVDGRDQIHIMNADGTGETDLGYHNYDKIHPSWSPDSTSIVYAEASAAYNSDYDIYVIKTDGTGLKRIRENSYYHYYDGDPSWGPAVPADGLFVTSPNGGESWKAGTLHSITWDQAGLEGTTVQISLLKNDFFYRVLTSSVDAAAETYAWTIPAGTPEGSSYKVSIMGDGVYDTSDDDFAITDTQSITVTSPNGGENWAAGTGHSITWDQTGLSGTGVKIDLYRSRAFYRTIASMVAADGGTYAWTIPRDIPEGTDYEVWITSLASPGISDYTDGWLTILAEPVIAVTTPDGGESWGVGIPHTITWDYSGPSGKTVSIGLLKSGGFYRIITSSTVDATSGYYSWTIPLDIEPGSDYTIMVGGEDAYDSSDGAFTITDTPEIMITSPDGGEGWTVNTQHAITWEQTGLSGDVFRIELSDSTSTIDIIAEEVDARAGTFTWTVPGRITTGSDYRIWIQSTTSWISDSSDGPFTILNGPSLTVSSPNAGGFCRAEVGCGIEWWYIGNDGDTVKIELLKGGELDRVISASWPIGSGGYGFYYWTPSSAQAVGDDYTIRVSGTSDPSLHDVSGTFSVFPPWTVRVVAPDGGEVWKTGTPQTISWDYYLPSTANRQVQIHLYKDGRLERLIAEGVQVGSDHHGSYSWTPNGLSDGNDYTIKVTLVPGGDMDDSDAPFTLSSTGIQPLPGFSDPPTDPDGDCIYEDLNANGRKDFADVVLYFNQMDWIAANEPIAVFDLNGNGRIDFADIVALFNEV